MCTWLVSTIYILPPFFLRCAGGAGPLTGPAAHLLCICTGCRPARWAWARADPLSKKEAGAAPRPWHKSYHLIAYWGVRGPPLCDCEQASCPCLSVTTRVFYVLAKLSHPLLTKSSCHTRMHPPHCDSENRGRTAAGAGSTCGVFCLYICGPDRLTGPSQRLITTNHRASRTRGRVSSRACRGQAG